MKKTVFFITLIAVVALHAATLSAEQTQAAPQSIPTLKSNFPQTIICPATITVKIATHVFPASGWPGYMKGSILGNEALIAVPFKLTEIKGDLLLCWYQHNAFCSNITTGGNYGNCEFYIYQEKPGYFCEKAPSNNGFVCRIKKPIE